MRVFEVFHFYASNFLAFNYDTKKNQDCVRKKTKNFWFLWSSTDQFRTMYCKNKVWIKILKKFLIKIEFQEMTTSQL